MISLTLWFFMRGLLMNDDFLKKIEWRVEQFRYFQDSSKLTTFQDALKILNEALASGNKILVFGNGGSATQASHFAAELVNRFYFNRRPLPALALTSDMACITSIGNDTDFKYIFSRQLEALGKGGDIALGLTTGGRSPNIMEAFRSAKNIGMRTIALCGPNTGELIAVGVDTIISVPSQDTPVIQELHLFFLHMAAEILEKKFFNRR